MNDKLDGVTESFIESYGREYYFFHELAKEVKTIIENKLDSSGVKAMVTFRAKSVKSIKDKIDKRNASSGGKSYQSAKDIYEDIVDLSGVRVALYFPDELKKVSKIIDEEFDVIKVKDFPDDEENKNAGIYTKKFDGYHARHYRVKLKTNDNFSNHVVEVQIASVLMHAWSEVEHDLDYKPASGSLSVEELMILDEINGLVISGNIALERLQHAMLNRINDADYIFRDHFDLAAFLSLKVDYGEIINSREIYNLLKRLDAISKSKVNTLVVAVNSHIEQKIKALEDRHKQVTPDGLASFKSGFLEALICLIICREWSTKVLDLMMTGYKVFDEQFKNQDIIFNCLRFGEDKEISTAFNMLWKLRYLGENRFDEFDLNKFDKHFKPINQSVTRDEALAAVEELVEALKIAGSMYFDADSLNKIASAAKVVNEKVSDLEVV
ncbi:RelA/SpoT domain-containing protein [Pantoea alfalfae]|uniref:GTP pyrophosphokinase n=1 Tax=Pantoea alfalfae TaxID=3074822 RepID=UPI001CA43A20|nr:RelA/SpoT domain-containing protein [Pantoea alfalfae]QZX96522.1 RelA/SpoT domain-containing protein [Pantoea alfalfae]